MIETIYTNARPNQSAASMAVFVAANPFCAASKVATRRVPPMHWWLYLRSCESYFRDNSAAATNVLATANLSSRSRFSLRGSKPMQPAFAEHLSEIQVQTQHNARYTTKNKNVVAPTQPYKVDTYVLIFPFNQILTPNIDFVLDVSWALKSLRFAGFGDICKHTASTNFSSLAPTCLTLEPFW